MTTAQKLGKYEIQSQVSRTSRSAVYRGVDPESGQAVAVKVIAREQANAQSIPAFVKYARSLDQLGHPGIARFIEVVETAKAFCIVSAFAEGQPLATLLKDGAHPDGRIAWDIVRQVLETLAVAHVHGGVHRDIKPSNVLLAAEGRVTLVNFGTAMVHATPEEHVEHFAPEHFGEGKISARSDLYQVGILVYQLVTGKVPFTGTAAEIEHRVMQERPTDPSSFNNRLAWQLDWVIQKALSKDPVERFASALEFGDGLRLGLQDTVGRPLEPVKINASKPATLAPNLLQNAKAIAQSAAGAKALAQAATEAPPAPPAAATNAAPIAKSGSPAPAAAAAPRAPAIEKLALDPKKAN